jgi:hypothetical protein
MYAASVDETDLGGWMFNPTRILALLAPVVALSFLLGACGGDDSVSSSEIEEKAKTSLTAKVGQEPAAIDCPSDLEAKQGETETCTLTDEQGTTYDMTATITSVSGDNYELDFQVADKPND